MRKAIAVGLVLFIAVAFGVTLAPAQDENPNGFPSGPHYNMNIIGKKAGFTCPAPETDPLTLLPIYGNTVFVPESGLGIQILMQSGSTKGKTASTFTELKAVDPCAGFDGNAAMIQLPPNADGYRVYARALAKPTDNPDEPTMTMTPGLNFVNDEADADLVYIGLVTQNGFETSSQVTRIKGKSKAIPVSDMFMWTGTVCYNSPPVDNDTGLPEPGYDPTPMCWVDSNSNGIYDYGDSFLPQNSDGTCAAGVPLSLYCHLYDSAQWVFNIADFVEYFWSLDTNGSKLVQIRFYPN